MLVELGITDLGIIRECRVVLSPGMTAVTGETGAGKTLVVDAIELLVGARAEGHLVRQGASEAVVEGRFVVGDREHVLRRVVPREGRSRAYLDGRLATVGALGELGAELVDLHGQHAHQSLLSASAQRRALDTFGAVPLGDLEAARAEVTELSAELEKLGGDERVRAREVDVLRHQIEELEAAGLNDADEDEHLDALEGTLADAVEHRVAGAQALEALTGEGAVADLAAVAAARLEGRAPFSIAEQRLRGVLAEITDIAADLRGLVEQVEEDPERLSQVRARRQLLADLRRKYGDTLGEVMAYHQEAEARLEELVRHDERAGELQARLEAARARLRQAEETVGRARREAAPQLAAAVVGHLASLAMPSAQLDVEVSGRAGQDVRLLLGANPGVEPLPLTKVASGGELARTMLALRLVLTAGPPTLVFDEVDAGVGGEAALALGAALGELAADHQVLVVTHLPQVAAHADHHLSVHKSVAAGETEATAVPVHDEQRLAELSRMLSGSPASTTARRHAQELLAQVRGAAAEG